MVSLRAYARHRAARGLPGATLSAVQRAIREGRVQVDSSGKIDPDAADLAWANNTRMMAAESRRPAKAAPGRSGARESAGPNLARAQLAHELVRVKKASLEVGQLEGTLVNAHDIQVELSDHITTARNRLLAIENEARTRFGDDIADWLRSEIRRALTELSAYRPGGGPDGQAGA